MWDWILLVLLGLLTVTYWYLRRHHGHWKSVGVYTAPGVLPGVGHLKDAALFKKSAGWLMCEMYHQTKDHPAVGVYMFRKPTLMLRDPDLIKDVLIREFSSFHDNALVVNLDEKLNAYVSKNLFVQRGQSWKSSRPQLSPAFSVSRMKAMFPMLQRICKEFNDYMEKRLNNDINVYEVVSMFASEIIAKCAFGLDGNIFKDPNAEFYKQGKKLWEDSLYNPLIMFITFWFPVINTLLGRGLFPKDVLDFFASTIRQTAEYRKNNPDKVPDDYIQYFFNLQLKNEEFTIEDVIGQSLTFFTDGFETSAVVASFAIHELTVNPDIQEAVRQEILAMESFNYDTISALPLLDRVLQETLRKYGQFMMAKVCTKDCVLKAGDRSFPVRKGQDVVIPVYGIHHDPEIYPDPSKFDPDRFLPENVKSRHPMTYLPFGSGPRMCIGQRFATCQVKVLIVNMLANFRLVKCSKTVDDLKLSPIMPFPVAASPTIVRFQKLLSEN